MGLPIDAEHRARVEAFQRRHRIGVLSLFFTDMVGSTQIKQQLGDLAGVPLIQRHHALVREILHDFPEGEEIDRAGDSFFIVFAKPSDAVRFALRLQACLRELSATAPLPVLDRMGIHLGEVIIADQGAKKDLYGIQVDMCARVMSLAAGDQLLMTRSVFDSARQVLKGQDLPGVGLLSWLNHGPYSLKGVDDPLDICEVGEVGRARLQAPTDTEKAWRQVSPGSEPVLGWRPAVGQLVPNTHWALEQKLGEGGFGEVWLARHETLKEARVLKFCFRADRVRSLKREVTLFRLLKERVGAHPHIVGVQDVNFDEPPYYLVMDYAAGKDLRAWCEAQGGVSRVPRDTLLAIVAQVADALEAAHQAGVIHRDIKPTNILVTEAATPDAAPAARLTDFGIGQVVSSEALAEMTRLGFTQTMLATGSGSQTGTMMYLAPELIAGRPATPASDVYALGVVLYQLLTGDFAKPLTMDWPRLSGGDELLREDLAKCFAGEPQDRFATAGELARSLRSLPDRRRVLAESRRLQTAAELAYARRRAWLRLAYIVGGVLALALAIAGGYRLARPPPPSEGSLLIITDPPGAEVWIDGKRVGVTPCREAARGRKLLSFEVRRPDYQPYRIAMPLEPGKDLQFMVVLAGQEQLFAAAGVGQARHEAHPESLDGLRPSLEQSAREAEARALAARARAEAEAKAKSQAVAGAEAPPASTSPPATKAPGSAQPLGWPPVAPSPPTPPPGPATPVPGKPAVEPGGVDQKPPEGPLRLTNMVLTNTVLTPAAPDLGLTMLVSFQGTVQVCRSGSEVWGPAGTNQVLQPGDLIRTGAQSKANLRRGTMIFRVGELTTLIITPGPSTNEIRIPHATSAIRG